MAKTPSAAVAAAAAQSRREIPKDKLDKVRALAREARDVDQEIADLEERVEHKRERANQIKTKELVDLMTQVGITSLDLARDGNVPPYELELKPYYHANIGEKMTDEQRATAFAYLEKQRAGDLIKTVVTVALGRGDRKAAKKVEAALRKLKVDFQVTLGVPWNTLTAWLKEQVEERRTTPRLDLIGGTVGKVVKMKPKKES